MKPMWAAMLKSAIDDLAKGLGTLLVDSFHYLALATLIIRFGSNRFPSGAGDDALKK